MNTKLTENFNKYCEKHKTKFENWSIRETRSDFYMQIKPRGSVEVCCGCKKSSNFLNNLNIESLIAYALQQVENNT